MELHGYVSQHMISLDAVSHDAWDYARVVGHEIDAARAWHRNIEEQKQQMLDRMRGTL